MAAPYAWGIDIGNRALKAVRLAHGPNGLVIDDFDVVEHEQVLSNAGDNRESLIHSALANFVQRHDLKKTPVAIGVSGQSSFARFIKLPPVEPRKIPEIVRFEAIQQIPFPLDEVEWSYQLFTDPKSPDVEVGIFAMRKDLVNQHIAYFTDAGLNVQTVQMNPLAVYNAMYHDDRIKGSTMIVDLGSENTDLIIAEGETIWLRSIPIGGNKFTEALATQFKLKFPKAEELKRNAATSKYGRQILQAMKPVFNELVSEIQRSIGFYASVHRDSRITRVLALGGTFRLPGLQKYVQQNLQIEVQRVDRFSAGAPTDAKAGTLFNENILSSASAYGLAIQALGGAKINSSLLPMHIRREKMWRDKTPWFGAAAAIFVAAPLLAYGAVYFGQTQLAANKPIDDQNTRILQDAQRLSGQWDSNVESAGLPDRTRAVNYQSLRNGRGIQNTLLGDIANALPAATVIPIPVDKTKLPPRESRTDIKIDQLMMDYHPDMSQFMNMTPEQFRTETAQGGVQGIKVQQNAATAGVLSRPGFSGTGSMGTGNRPTFGGFGTGGGGYGGGGRPINNQPNPNQPAAGGPAQRGFVVEIVCTTPNGGGASYVLSNLVAKLKQLKSSDPDVDYKVDKVEAPVSMQLKNDPAYVQLQAAVAQAATNAANANNAYGQPAGGFRPPAPAPGTATPAGTNPADQQPAYDPTKDPITGEDLGNDTRVKIYMSVLLDPPKPPPGTPGGAPQASAR
ncbi:MAG TPA: type IV pilus assembly protein PilM [Tepidisphaeraceae bacterium]